MGGLTPVVPPPIPDIDLRRKPLLARKTTWAVMAVALLVGGAFWAGSRGLQRQPPVLVPSAIPTVPRRCPSLRFSTWRFSRIRRGQRFFVVGENEALGKTPFRKKFEYREDKPTFLVFRLPGYRELTHEVRPDWSGLVVLDPIPGQPATEVKPPIAAKPSKGEGPSRSGHRKNRPGKDIRPVRRRWQATPGPQLGAG